MEWLCGPSTAKEIGRVFRCVALKGVCIPGCCSRGNTCPCDTVSSNLCDPGHENKSPHPDIFRLGGDWPEAPLLLLDQFGRRVQQRAGPGNGILFTLAARGHGREQYPALDRLDRNRGLLPAVGDCRVGPEGNRCG